MLLAGPAVAQQASDPAGKPAAGPAAAPVAAEPAATSATYGDWILRCQRVGEGDKARRLCEVAQSIRAPNQQGLLGEVALGRVPTDSKLHLTAVLPPSVAFPSTVQLATSEKTPHSIELQWRRCLPGGCFADAAPTDEQIRIWRGLTDAGKITFRNALGQDTVLPVSFRGLAQALDAMGKA